MSLVSASVKNHVKATLLDQNWSWTAQCEGWKTGHDAASNKYLLGTKNIAALQMKYLRISKPTHQGSIVAQNAWLIQDFSGFLIGPVPISMRLWMEICHNVASQRHPKIWNTYPAYPAVKFIAITGPPHGQVQPKWHILQRAQRS